MNFRLWDINNQKYCKNYEEIAARISFVVASEGSKFAVFTVNMPEFAVEFDTECMDMYHEPIFGNDRVKYKDIVYNVVFEDGIFVLYPPEGDEPDYVLSKVASECEIVGTAHDEIVSVEPGKTNTSDKE